MSLIALNAGITISPTVVLERPLIPSTANMGAVLAFVQAIIDKSYLTFVDLPRLQAAFPSRVSIVNTTVTLAGPVLIIPQFGPLKKTLVQTVALSILSVASYFACKTLFKTRPGTIQTAQALQQPPVRHPRLCAAGCALVVAGVTVWAGSYVLGRNVGVHFL